MPYIPFARQSKASTEAIGYNGERLVNYFLRPSEGGVSPAVLIGRTGLTELASLGGAVRAMVETTSLAFICTSAGVYSITPAGMTVKIGQVKDSVQTTMAWNGTQLAIVADDTYYIYDGSTLSAYDTGSVLTPRTVVFKDGYFIVTGETLDRKDALTISGLYEGKTFSGLDLAFAESMADGLRGSISDHSELWLFGERTIEVWYNSGNADFPFERSQGATMERGCLDGQTIAKADNAVYWVGQDKIVYRSGGGSPEVISTREIEEVIQTLSVVGGFTFTDRGHFFYAIQTDKTTLCYDITTGLWSEFSTGTDESPWLGCKSCVLQSIYIFGTSNGKVCIQSGYTDDGQVLEASATSMPVEQSGKPFTISELYLAMEAGGTDIGRNAKVMLQIRRDGRRFGTETSRSIGRIGEYNKRISWRGLGQFYRAQICLTVTDPIQRDMYGISYG